MIFRLSLSKEDFGTAKTLLQGSDINFDSYYPDPHEENTRVIQFRSATNMGKLADLLAVRQIDFDITAS